MTMFTDFSFPRHYECEILEELPGRGAPSHHFFQPVSQSGGKDGVVLRVHPEGVPPWLGTFAFGAYGPSGVSRVLSMPDPTKVCVVAKGEGYIVPVSDPQRWEPVRVGPVIDVRSILEARLVIFADFTALAAYGNEGLRWRTKRLTWSNMKLIEVTKERIVGEYDDLGSDQPRTFEVDVATGTHTGGVEN